MRDGRTSPLQTATAAAAFVRRDHDATLSSPNPARGALFCTISLKLNHREKTQTHPALFHHISIKINCVVGIAEATAHKQ
jgi:hypothetical protein